MKFYWNDIWNFASKLTPRRFFNAFKVLLSFYLARYTQKPIQWGLPVTISFEPTTFCNLRCPECPSGLRAFTRPTGMLSTDFFSKTISELHPSLLYLYFYFQGEPYLNPNFLDMVAHAAKHKIYTVTSTNAHYLTDNNARRTVEAGLDRLIISVDGTTQATYEAYRVGGQLSKVIDGAKNMVKWKKQLKSKTPHLVFQFLVVRPNQHQINELYTLAREIGIDEVKLKTAQVYDYQNGNPLIPTIDIYARYAQKPNGTWQIKNSMLNQCWKLWHSCVITWDGRIVPCCFDKDAQHQLGDLKQQSFTQIWQGAAYQNFRKAILKSRSEIDICANCSEGTKVWA
ncbi:MAG: SPASM domain-containing protein [Sphingobacteriales bacterium]|jgi:radical SAM protein with 4Fe4S-binding SPASM domain|nr:SPASM domain-containing protein [Sphingobacteriales bacterium]MBP9142680.1 SPASM domain-containing protein [Chitinophagales bacterium]MDA0199663.1 SPASM domain-containing protein [Bacteroidota bacterium]MBK6888377.1 SPASM domain-containing protein [Sphingobacteriales bacterium]MBK7527184.1 SPASM domain-containing protein [Sphingobacteriales bacterium]